MPQNRSPEIWRQSAALILFDLERFLRRELLMNSKKIFAGVSISCGYPEYPEVTLAKFCELGIKRVEIFLNTHSESEPEYIRSLAAILKANGTKCVSLHPYTCTADTYMLYSGYERRTKDYIEYHKRYFEAMNILGADYFILHGNKADHPDSVVIEGYRRLNEAAKSFGVRVLQENVCRCTTGELSQLISMKKALGDDVGFVLDTKQAVRKKLDPYDFISALGSSIKHVHFSDHGEKGDCLLPGQGDIGCERFITALKNIGFEGSIILELYRRNYHDYHELASALLYLQGIIDRCC